MATFYVDMNKTDIMDTTKPIESMDVKPYKPPVPSPMQIDNELNARMRDAEKLLLEKLADKLIAEQEKQPEDYMRILDEVIVSLRTKLNLIKAALKVNHAELLKYIEYNEQKFKKARMGKTMGYYAPNLLDGDDDEIED